jgi:hypothetical protein
MLMLSSSWLLFVQELLGVARVPEVELILGVFKMLKLYFKQSL